MSVLPSITKKKKNILYSLSARSSTARLGRLALSSTLTPCLKCIYLAA